MNVRMLCSDYGSKAAVVPQLVEALWRLCASKAFVSPMQILVPAYVGDLEFKKLRVFAATPPPVEASGAEPPYAKTACMLCHACWGQSVSAHTTSCAMWCVTLLRRHGRDLAGRCLLQSSSSQKCEVMMMTRPEGVHRAWTYVLSEPVVSPTYLPTSQSDILRQTGTGQEPRASQATQPALQRRTNRRGILQEQAVACERWRLRPGAV